MPIKSIEGKEREKTSIYEFIGEKAAKNLYMVRQNTYHSYRETILFLQKRQLLKTRLQ